MRAPHLSLGSSRSYLFSAPSILLALMFGGCSGDDGATGPAGPAGPPGSGSVTKTDLAQGDELPGLVFTISELSGGTATGGNFRVGDTVAVHYTVKKSDGSDWDIAELASGRALVSGPTSNYQRVIAEQSDLFSASVRQEDGSYVYAFASAIPPTYLAPLNDTASFGADDGELAGLALLDGTYSVAIYGRWNYTLDGEAMRLTNDAVSDFLVGNAGALTGRAVVGQANCNRCHDELQAHGGSRRNVTLCLMCHTAGAEDKNVPSAAGGTPGVTVDFKVMIHRIHNGAHLPSVLGVATNPDGSRNYAATPAPYQIVGYQNSINDFSAIGFPIMPSAYASYLFDSTGTTYQGVGGNGPMPRDLGYSALGLSQKLIEDKLRTGAVACDKCHGDPDGTGPIDAPAQGDNYKTHPAEAACYSCHDDVVPGQPYVANGQLMPDTANDSNCVLCHTPSGSASSVQDAHLHPYSNSILNTGVNIDISGVSGGTAISGNHVSGDPIQVTFSVTDDAGVDLQIHRLTRFQMIVTGPTQNPQWVLPNANTHDFAFRKSSPFTGNGTISTPVVGAGALLQTIAVVFSSATTFGVEGSVSATLAGQTIGAGAGSTAIVSYNGVDFTITQGSTGFANGDRWHFEAVPTAASYTINVPRDLLFERLGLATGAAETLAVGNVPVAWGRETVYERTALVGAPSTTTADTIAMGRYLVVDAATLAGVAVGDRVVLGQGSASEEYGQVVRIETSDPVTGVAYGTQDRVFLSQQLRYDHASGTAVQEVTLSGRRQGVDYTLAKTGATGIDLLAGRFTAGNPVVMSYRTDARFGWYRAPGESLQAVYTPGTGDSEDLEATWGDWTGLPLADGTYSVGAWGHKDFTVTPLGLLTATGSSSNLNTDNTTYRMISPPAHREFLFGSATQIETRGVIASGDSCNACHGDLQAHGNGRRGFETCILCHASPGMEDAPLYSFNNWYIGPTRGATMDFRTLLHKIHMGKELTNASSYAVNGIFLGVAYPVHVDEIGFPNMPGGVNDCTTCHGQSNTAWRGPAGRNHPDATIAPVRTWRAVCGSCHDSDAVQAHTSIMTTPDGVESCETCHGASAEWSVQRMHKVY